MNGLEAGHNVKYSVKYSLELLKKIRGISLFGRTRHDLFCNSHFVQAKIHKLIICMTKRSNIIYKGNHCFCGWIEKSTHLTKFVLKSQSFLAKLASLPSVVVSAKLLSEKYLPLIPFTCGCNAT